MGRFWFPSSITSNHQPYAWCLLFHEAIQQDMVSAQHQQGSITSSDLELATMIVGHATQQAHIPPLPYYHTCLATENMPAATWLHKRSHTTLGPPAYLLPALANTCQTYNCTISPIFTLGASHTISKFLSRSFHLDDDIILQHMQSMVPVHLPWKLVTPPVHITSFMNLALLSKMQPEPSL